jgi:hypothetical protein
MSVEAARRGEVRPIGPESLAAAAASPIRVVRGPRTLLLADEPERIERPGILYRDVVCGPFRVFAYGLVAGAAPLALSVWARAGGADPAAVRLERVALGGPGAGFFQVGGATLHGWLAGPPMGTVVRVPPGRPARLAAAPAARPGHAVNLVLDAEAEGLLEVSVVAAPGATPEAGEVLPPGPRPAGLPMRGTFPAADLRLEAEARPGTVLRLAHPATYLTGHSAVDGIPVVDYGNYGVRYEIALRAEPSRSARPTAWFVPLGGGFLGSLALGGEEVPLRAPDGRQLGAHQALCLGPLPLGDPGAPPLVLVWSPPAASYLPAALCFA